MDGGTPDELRELQRQAVGSGGTAVMADSVRRGFLSNQMLDGGREVKRQENDYRASRATLLARRDCPR